MGKGFMILSRLSLIFSVSLLSFQCIATICVNTSSNYKMFASTLRSGALARGHEQAFQDNAFLDYEFFSAGNDQEFANQIQNMSEGKCAIVLGLFTSRECLIAGTFLIDKKLIGISSSCGHDNIGKFSPYLYTETPPVSAFSSRYAKYLSEEYPSGEIIAVYQPTDIYSKSGFDYFKANFNKPVVEVPIESDGQFNTKAFDDFHGKKYTIIFFTYPLPSAKILVELNTHQLINNNVSIIGASSWIFDVSVFRPIKPILQKARGVIVADLIDWSKITGSPFGERFFQKYKREPLLIEILTYDVTNLAIKCYRKAVINRVYNIELFQTCIKDEKHQGISGEYSFEKTAPFANRPIYLTNMLDRI